MKTTPEHDERIAKMTERNTTINIYIQEVENEKIITIRMLPLSGGNLKN